ncbi:hypothetical protein [Streptomyces sp. NPDC092295]|uniref:hypothetical protein n=1 Tax=Streptomyces sp. NPDC092295 TaxID=3366011 RepID=UPI0037F798F6
MWPGRLETAARLDPLKGHRPPALLGCTASPANWATTTEDTATGRRIGLVAAGHRARAA